MTAPAQAASVLADPATVALLRDLYAHARHVNAEHADYSMGDGRGGAYGPKEHTWTAGELRVSYCDGELLYLSHGVPLLKVHVVSVRQAVDLLVVLDILPKQFSSQYKDGWHDGFFHTVEDETAAEIRDSWRTR